MARKRDYKAPTELTDPLPVQQDTAIQASCAAIGVTVDIHGPYRVVSIACPCGATLAGAVPVGERMQCPRCGGRVGVIAGPSQKPDAAATEPPKPPSARLDDSIEAWQARMTDVCTGCGMRALDAERRCGLCGAVKPLETKEAI